MNNLYLQYPASNVIINSMERLNFVSQDKEILRNYQLREMALSDWTTGINTAFEKGKMEVAKNALAEGATIDFVKKITGLDMETIQSL